MRRSPLTHHVHHRIARASSLLAELKAEHEQDIPDKKLKVFKEMRPGDAIEIKVPKPSAQKTPMIH